MTDLDEIAARYDPSAPDQFDRQLKRLQVQCMVPWLRGESVLELGCATGESTALLAAHCRYLLVVEGSIENINRAQERASGTAFVHAQWERFDTLASWSDVVAANALEHVDDPVALLRRAGEWLTPGGRVHIVVPNGLSLHRLVGVEMGLLPDPLTVTPDDFAQGHVRNYTYDSIVADVRAAGLRVVHVEPVFLKVVPNVQMVDWDDRLVDALHAVAGRFPEHGAEVYVVAER